MKWLIWLLIVMGLILGPVYYWDVQYLSGQIAQTEHVYGRSSGGVNGFNLVWNSPVKVHLEPSMNPIAFDLDMRIDLAGSDNLSNAYDTELKLGDQSVWKKEYSFSSRPVGPRRYTGDAAIDDHDPRLNVFNVSEAGDYTFEMKQKQEEIKVRQIDLQVRREIAEIEPGVVALGCVLFVAGVGLAIRRALAAGP